MVHLLKLSGGNADLDLTLSLVQGQLSSAKTQLQVGSVCVGAGAAGKERTQR